MPALLYFFLGLLGLWIGAELIIKAAQKIGLLFGLSETFIGLTILALGTDFPEIMISITGALQKKQGIVTDGIVVGNILGSNMGQIALILGLSGLFRVLKIKKNDTMHNGIMLLISTALFFIVALDGFISPVDGLIFVIMYLVYFISLRLLNRQSTVEKNKRRFRIKKIHVICILLELALGLLVLSESSQLVLDKGLSLAVDMGVNQLIIGIILVGFGSSLPELVVSINAAIKGANGLSVGNLIGSNIVDILVALGGSAILGGWIVERQVVMFDLPFLLLTTVVVVLFLLTKEKLERKESLLLLSLYGIYIFLKFQGW